MVDVKLDGDVAVITLSKRDLVELVLDIGAYTGNRPGVSSWELFDTLSEPVWEIIEPMNNFDPGKNNAEIMDQINAHFQGVSDNG